METPNVYSIFSERTITCQVLNATRKMKIINTELTTFPGREKKKTEKIKCFSSKY